MLFFLLIEPLIARIKDCLDLITFTNVKWERTCRIGQFRDKGLIV